MRLLGSDLGLRRGERGLGGRGVRIGFARDRIDVVAMLARAYRGKNLIVDVCVTVVLVEASIAWGRLCTPRSDIAL